MVDGIAVIGGCNGEQVGSMMSVLRGSGGKRRRDVLEIAL